MRAVFGGSAAGARDGVGQISRQAGIAGPKPAIRKNEDTRDRFAQVPASRPVTHINGERIYFGDLARFAWPRKTEFFLAELTRVDPRTCRRWISGQNEPPADALGVVLAEIMKRFHQRD